MAASDPAANWTYSTNTWRQANNNAANKIDFVRGVSEDMVSASLSVPVVSSTSTYRITAVGIGEDTTTTVSGRYSQEVSNNQGMRVIHAGYDGMPSAGRHYLSWNEYGGGADIQTWSSNGYFGIFGQLLG